MKDLIIYISLLLSLSISCSSCSKSYMYPNYDGTEDGEIEGPVDPVIPEDPYSTSKIRDLVLIYGAGTDRDQIWNKEAFYPYVVYEQNDSYNWMFDGFLFLELFDKEGYSYTSGHGTKPALKLQWQGLIDNYFSSDVSAGALDQCLTEVMKLSGNNQRKVKVTVGIPEPLRGAVEWGEVDGKMLDFSKDEDRVLGCKWFIDEVVRKFEAGEFQNLELEGFYWIAEEVVNTETMIASIGSYLEEREFTFSWIPWWKSPGYEKYRTYKFSDVYLQPNYFFYDVPFSRLQAACDEAKKFKINLEVEFDESVLGGNSQKMNDYLDVFEENDIYQDMKLAYYQSINTVLKLYKSNHPADKELYKRFCSIVSDRQKQVNPPYIK